MCRHAITFTRSTKFEETSVLNITTHSGANEGRKERERESLESARDDPGTESTAMSKGLIEGKERRGREVSKSRTIWQLSADR